MRTFLTFLFCGLTFALAAIAAIANFRYGLLVAAGQERYVFAMGGTFLDVVKTFLPLAIGTFLVGPLTPGTFFRKVAGWTLFAGLAAWSMTCALGLYAIAKNERLGDTVGQQALYDQLKDEKP